MGRKPKYSPEFKRDAVEYVVSSGKPIVEVAEALKVNESTLGHWVRDARRDPGVAGRADEVKALRRRVAELEEENEFLKKAASFFAANRA